MEGRREIEAAKLRLAAAKRQASLVAQLLNSANEEVAEAESYLAQAETRWEVIDVDDDRGGGGADAAAGRGSKKRKIEATGEELGGGFDSVQGDNDDSAAAAAATTRQSNDSGNNGDVYGDAVTAISQTRESMSGCMTRGATVNNGGYAVAGTAASVRASNDSDNSNCDRDDARSTHAARGRRRRVDNGTPPNPNDSNKAASRTVEIASSAVTSNAQIGSTLRQRIEKHRDDTLGLLKASASKGEASVPPNEMATARSRNLKLMRAANRVVMKVSGKTITTELSENELTTRMATAEAEAVQLYVKEIQGNRTLSQLRPHHYASRLHANPARSKPTQAIPAQSEPMTVALQYVSGEVCFIVSSCGVKEANGTYTRSFREGTGVYEKRGTLRGRPCTFVVKAREKEKLNYWLIGFYCGGKGGVTQVLYKSSWASSAKPPPTGWIPTRSGVAAQREC
ncbi:hypothetical protein ACHAWF_001853 [Thalassiosira exigua]